MLARKINSVFQNNSFKFNSAHPGKKANAIYLHPFSILLAPTPESFLMAEWSIKTNSLVAPREDCQLDGVKETHLKSSFL